MNVWWHGGPNCAWSWENVDLWQVVIWDAQKRSLSIWRPVCQDFPCVSEHYELLNITDLPKKKHHSKRKVHILAEHIMKASVSFSLLSYSHLYTMESTMECNETFQFFCICSPTEISHLVATEIPHDHLPKCAPSFLSNANFLEGQWCLKACNVHSLTGSPGFPVVISRCSFFTRVLKSS